LEDGFIENAGLEGRIWREWVEFIYTCNDFPLERYWYTAVEDVDEFRD